jgi:ATP-dependent Lhr-like helicase
MLFQDLWRSTTTGLRSRCITARSMSRSAARSRTRWRREKLRGVVCTSSLDLGIDWGDVDLVINVGAPKGASPADAAHRPRQPPPRRAVARVLVPANRFEVLECRAAIDAVAGAQDTPPLRTGALDVLAQHVLGCACGEPFLADELYEEVRSACALSRLDRASDFDDASSISSPPAATR